LVNNLDGVTPVVDHKSNLRFLKLEGRTAIHLWLKKANSGRQSSNFATPHAADFLSGQLVLYPNATMLMLGYLLSEDKLGVQKVSITPPCGRASKPEWWIDISVPTNVIGMPRPVGFNHTHITVSRSSQQRRL
jgi:hypothetical protein